MKSPVHLSSLGPWLNPVLFLEWLNSAKRGHDMVKSATWMKDFFFKSDQFKREPFAPKATAVPCRAQQEQPPEHLESSQAESTSPSVHLLNVSYDQLPSKEYDELVHAQHTRCYHTGLLAILWTSHALSCWPILFLFLPLQEWPSLPCPPGNFSLMLFSSILISPSLPSLSRIIYVLKHLYPSQLMSHSKVFRSCLPVRLG